MEKTTTLLGDRLARQGTLRLGCSTVIFDSGRENFLLTQRSDNGQWCLPGGMVEAGESVAEACIREIKEETGLDTRMTRLVGVYSDPHKLVVYPDGDKVHIVAINFEAEIIGGELSGSDETIDRGYFNLDQAKKWICYRATWRGSLTLSMVKLA